MLSKKNWIDCLKPLMLGLVLTVASCTTTSTTGTPAVCSVWQPITYSASKDTDETQQQVRANNAAREAYCE